MSGIECQFPNRVPSDVRTPISESTDASDFYTEAEDTSNPDGSEPLNSFSAPVQAPSNTELISFFLNFHEKHIMSTHYFRIYDHGDTCLHGLRNMAKQFEVLRYAIAAFSALVNSVKIGRGKQQAFCFYKITVQKLNYLLNKIPKNNEEFQALVATSLQLLAFDVFLYNHRN